MIRKKNVYLKISQDFFEREDIKEIQKLPESGKILILYLRLLAMAVKEEGYIRYDHIGRTPIEEVASFLRENKKDMLYAVEMLQRQHVLEETEDGSYYLPDAIKMMGRR